MNVQFPCVLITGANGFLGKSLCEFLAGQEYSVIAVTRSRNVSLTDMDLSVIRLDLMQDTPGWLAAMSRADCVIHLAANAHQFGAASRDVARFDEINTRGACFVAQMAARAGVKRFILLSSIKVNGENSKGGCYNATDIPNPQDAYAKSKFAAEIGVSRICTESSLQYVCIRPPLVYGPGVSANFLRLMQIVDRGTPMPFKSIDNRRSFVGIQNLNSFIQVCISHPLAGGTWLVSDNEDVSTPDLLRKLAYHLMRPSRLFAVSPRLLRLIGAALGRQSLIDRLC